MSWFNLKNLIKSSIYITPNLPVVTTKRYKFNFFEIVGFVLLYSFFVFLLFLALLTFTPLKNVLFLIDNKDLQLQTEKVKQLELRVAFLTKELESVASTNERIKYAIMLAKGDTVDSASAIYDSLRRNIEKKIPFGGNVYYAFTALIGDSTKNGAYKPELFFMEPASGPIIQKFMPDKGHFGIDFGLRTGTPVAASIGGLVIFSGYDVDYGYTIMIQSDNGFITAYKHCSSLLKKERDVVYVGETIALSGNSGKNTTGPHLHFEVWQNGKAIDPEKVLIN